MQKHPSLRKFEETVFITSMKKEICLVQICLVQVWKLGFAGMFL